MKPLLSFVSLATALLAASVAWSDDDVDIETLEEQAIAAAVDRVAPSVVRIEAIGGLQKSQGVLIGEGPTTGLVVSSDGYIISSAYNFIQQPASVLVTLASGERLAAEIVARDHARKLVLLHVENKKPLVVPEAAKRSDIRVGQWALALGRTFSAEHPNVSVGIVSATNRIWSRAIQTDAKISPNNYGGPLVDIHGRVMGVLSPLSPQSSTEISGAEWYDSGIGFAAPLEDIFTRLEKLKRGEDIHAGLLGVSIKGDDFTEPAEVAVCQPKSPAADAGIQVGDIIVAVNGVAVRRLPELKHALGRHDAGQTVKITISRGEERFVKTAELVDKLLPYAHPFLGVLPLRDAIAQDGAVEKDAAQKGVELRYVFEGGPAAEAGLLMGDRIVSLNSQPTENADQLRNQIAEFLPGEEIALKYERENTTHEAMLQLASLPTDIPPPLPPSRAGGQAEREENAANQDIVEITLPEEAGKCFAFIPKTYLPETPHGVVVWLRKPGPEDREQLVARWTEHCEKNDLILLAPQPSLPSRWLPTEAAFIRKTLDKAIADYNIDPTRVVVHGRGAGGSMAYLFGFANRDIVRAIAAVDAAFPARSAPPANEPLERLAIFATKPSDERMAERSEAALKKLTEMKYPVTQADKGGDRGGLTDKQRGEFARWTDALDRI